MNYFFDTFLAQQKKVTRPPGRTPGISRCRMTKGG
jgi:hypothetical protein